MANSMPKGCKDEMNFLTFWYDDSCKILLIPEKEYNVNWRFKKWGLTPQCWWIIPQIGWTGWIS